MPLNPESWIKLNGSSFTLYGLPLDVHAGLHEFMVSAVNRYDKMTGAPLEVFDFIVHILCNFWAILILVNILMLLINYCIIIHILPQWRQQVF